MDGSVQIHGTTEVSYSDGSTSIAQDVTFATLIDHALADPSVLEPLPSSAPEQTLLETAPANATDLTALVEAYVTTAPITDSQLAEAQTAVHDSSESQPQHTLESTDTTADPSAVDTVVHDPALPAGTDHLADASTDPNHNVVLDDSVANPA